MIQQNTTQICVRCGEEIPLKKSYVLIPGNTKSEVPCCLACYNKGIEMAQQNTTYPNGESWPRHTYTPFPDFSPPTPTVPGLTATPEMDALVERVAALEHEQWAHWTKHMLANLTPENVERWERQAATPYAGLTEAEKDGDREWAEKVLDLLMEV